MEQTAFIENNKYKQLLLHGFIWAIFLVFNVMQPHLETEQLIKRVLFVVCGNMMVFYLNYFYLVPEFLLKKKTFWYVVIILVLVVILTYLFNLFSPEFRPQDNFKPLEEGFKNPPPRPDNKPDGFFHIRLIGPFVFNILLVVTGTALRVYGEWNKNERKKQEIEVQKSSTELYFLKHQLNPHFLFNSLNSIYSLTTQKSNDAPEAVITLSELMRYMLYETNQEFVPLSKELEYIQNYLKLQRLRIAKNENVTLNIRGNEANQKIRPLLLISFIENAFKYGTDFKGNTEVKIEININEDELQFKCVNLIGRTKVNQDHSGIGLKNTRERLDLLYPGKHMLEVEDTGQRFTVDLTLKLS